METGFWGLETEQNLGLQMPALIWRKVLTSVHEPRLKQDIFARYFEAYKLHS